MRPRPGGRGEAGTAARAGVDAAASMRPRPGGRGEVTRGRTATQAAVQRFNAATTRRPWRARRKYKSVATPDASMRPRPGGRGEG